MTGPIHGFEVEVIALADLHPHPQNARRGDVTRIMESLRENGQYSPIVMNRGTVTGRPNEILAGHHLVQAARKLDWQSVSVVAVNVDDDAAKRILLADNRTSDLATYDDRLLVEILGSLDGLHGTGYDPGDLEALESLFKEHSWEVNDKDLQDTLDEADKDGWPVIKVKIAPPLHVRFLEVPGQDDTERVTTLIQEWDEGHE